jgi:hypothetical protein
MSMDRSEGTASSEDRGFWIATIFVGFVFVAAILLTLYVLLWDGGAHT